jgi:hypothetical protein
VVVFRCTRKLLGHLQHKSDVELPTSTTRLGDWYANLLIIRRQHLVLAVSGTTLLPVMIPAAPYKTMIPRWVAGASEMLRALGIPASQIAAEQMAMRDAVVTTTNDRRVLGSMNDFTFMTEGYIEHEPSLLHVALKLAEAPCSPLGMNNPREATRALLGMPTLRLVKR